MVSERAFVFQMCLLCKYETQGHLSRSNIKGTFSENLILKFNIGNNF